MLRMLSFVLAIACAALANAQTPQRDFSKWENEIAGIEKRDAAKKPEQGCTVFVGSSSIRLWDIATSFPKLSAVNHGFGGSTIADATHFFDRLVLPLKPKTIVFYSGDNDVASGMMPQAVHDDFVAFIAAARKQLPDVRIVFIPIKPSPARWKLYDKQTAANKLIKATLEQTKNTVYVDVVPPMLDAEGQPRRELFVADQLHMNAAGYAIWTKLLERELSE